MNQQEAMAQAAAVQKSGSNDSLQNSTTNAMRAMIAMGEGNQPTAVSHGYEAFGQYKTSQNLDADRIRSRIRQIDLFTNNLTVNSKIPAWATSHDTYLTTYGRLDPGFLRQGDAKAVADEFEKKSGMRRETFLKKMAEASESTISADDPNMTAKVMNKFSSFLDAIPNEDFRNKVQEQIESVSPKSRSTMIVNGAKHIFEVLASKGINLGTKVVALVPDSAAEPDRAPSSEAAPEAATSATPAAPRPEDPLSSTKKDFVQYMAPQDAEFRGLDKEKFANDAFGGIMTAALDEQSVTIFKQVSKRYRAVAPSLMK